METASAKSDRHQFGRDVILVFVALVALSVVILGNTIFSYLAILAASALRNIYLGWIGSGLLFDLVTGIFLLVEAAIIAAFVQVARRLLA